MNWVADMLAMAIARLTPQPADAEPEPVVGPDGLQSRPPRGPCATHDREYCRTCWSTFDPFVTPPRRRTAGGDP